MKLLFLGTGAADWPQQADRSRPFRRHSSALLDGTLLLDPGGGVPDALADYGRSLSDIRAVLCTHRHADHWNDRTCTLLAENGAVFYDLHAGETQKIGSYTVSAYRANHGTCADAVHFLITDGTSTLFYGLDGAWLLYDEIEAIRHTHVQFAVLDATVGEQEGDYRIFEHNNLRMVREMKKSLLPYIDRFCINHMARTLHPSHAQLAASMEKDGIETAWDGWETSF